MESSLIVHFIWACFLIQCSLCKDDFGIWHRTLAPFQSHACDNEELLLRCTQNTIISVHYVFYGRTRQSAHLCPGKRSAYYPSGACTHPKALQVIHEKCHKSMMCRLQISPDLFRGDPCPGVGKFVEVVYKCRPELFLNKIVCEDQQLELKCPFGQGLTIYSASFGTSRSGVDECPQPNGATVTDCLVDDSDAIVRSLCSGKENCSLLADHRTFGDSSCSGYKYLKVAYNCVEKELLLPMKQTPEDSYIQTTSFPAWAKGIDIPDRTSYLARMGVTDRPAEMTRQEMQSDEIPTDVKGGTEKQHLVGFMSKWMSAHKYMAGNIEKLVLYLSISLIVGIIAFGTFLGGRCIIKHLESRRSSSVIVSPDAEEQFLSDKDAETSFDPDLLRPPVLDYTASMRRQDSVAVPRAPINDDVEMNHYFS